MPWHWSAPACCSSACSPRARPSAAPPAAPPCCCRAGGACDQGDFPVNKTAVAAGITPESVGASWRLTLRGGPSEVVLDRARAGRHAATHRTAADRLRRGLVDRADLERGAAGRAGPLAGVPAPRSARVASLQRGGAFGAATLQANQIGDPDALLALRVNGADLSLDHGYPARIIVPGAARRAQHQVGRRPSSSSRAEMSRILNAFQRDLRISAAASADHGVRLRAAGLHSGHLQAGNAVELRHLVAVDRRLVRRRRHRPRPAALPALRAGRPDAGRADQPANRVWSVGPSESLRPQPHSGARPGRRD